MQPMRRLLPLKKIKQTTHSNTDLDVDYHGSSQCFEAQKDDHECTHSNQCSVKGENIIKWLAPSQSRVMQKILTRRERHFKILLELRNSVCHQKSLSPVSLLYQSSVDFFFEEAGVGNVWRSPAVIQGSTADMRVITELCLDLDPGKRASLNGKLWLMPQAFVTALWHCGSCLTAVMNFPVLLSELFCSELLSLM